MTGWWWAVVAAVVAWLVAPWVSMARRGTLEQRVVAAWREKRP